MPWRELPSLVTRFLEHFGQRHIYFLWAERRSGNAGCAHAAVKWIPAHNEGSAARGVVGLSVMIGEDHAFLGDAVDVGRIVHQALGITQVAHSDIVVPNDQDSGIPLGITQLRIGFLKRCGYQEAIVTGFGEPRLSARVALSVGRMGHRLPLQSEAVRPIMTIVKPCQGFYLWSSLTPIP